MSASGPGTLLSLSHVTRRFGGLVAVNDLSLDVTAGTIHGLIGPNGAGKSTAFDLISGLTPLSSGELVFDGSPITRARAEDRVAAGICRTFQTPRLFERMTVLATVMTGCFRHGTLGFMGSMLSVSRKRREEEATLAQACRQLDLVGLMDDADRPVGDLSYGKRRLVEIARALATGPKLLLLDEVTSGLNPVETAAIGQLIRKLVSSGLTVMLVEHDMAFVMGLCERITVLNFGSRIADGIPSSIASDEAVITAYLGRRDEGRPRRRDLRHAAREPTAT